ncbi:hypothetical protein ABK040_009776 [Willaertia magna]
MPFFETVLKKVGLRKQTLRIIVVGLDGSGKSSIINFLKPTHEQESNILPTVGFKIEEFVRNNYNCRICDLGGIGKYRSMWKYFFDKVNGILFVIDFTDKKRLCTARDELHELLKSKKLQGVPVLICINKIDQKENNISISQIQQILSIDEHTQSREWKVEGTSAKEGTAVEEAFHWLVNSAATFLQKQKDAKREIIVNNEITN